MELKVDSDLFKIAAKTCSLKLKQYQSLWSMWTWKLDAFSIKEQDGKYKTIDIEISLDKQKHKLACNLEELKLLCKEHTGLFCRKVYQLSHSQTLWMFTGSNEENKKTFLSYIVNAQWDKIQLLEDHTETQGQAAFEYLAQMMPGVLAKWQMLTIHSALIEYQGAAFAVCAPSGVGKTTHARLWRDAKNALILNGDRTVCEKVGGQWIAYGTPWSGTSGDQINRQAPLKAVVILNRSEENKVQKLSKMDAFRKIFPQLVYPSWNQELTGIIMDILNQLLEDIPVYCLYCRPDREAVEVLEREIYKEKQT